MNIKHLMAMRTQLDAIQIQLDAMIDEQLNAEQLNAGSVNKEVGCTHARAVDISTMGEPRRFFCRECGITQEYETSKQDGTLTCANEGGT